MFFSPSLKICAFAQVFAAFVDSYLNLNIWTIFIS